MYIQKRLFIWLFIGFVLATVAGTLTHEFGHYLAAEILGYDAIIHYGSTGIVSSPPHQEKGPSDGFWITFGGPLQTLLTGSIGLILLFVIRKSFNGAIKLSFAQWSLIFISLFWLRQPANLFTWLVGYFVKGRFSRHGDEIQLAEHLNLPNWTIVLGTAILGLIVLAIVIFNFIPKNQRLTFIAAGLAGGITGYILWLKVLGKIILP